MTFEWLAPSPRRLMPRFLRPSLLIAVAIGLIGASAPVAAEVKLETLRLPDGFVAELYAEGVIGARSMALSEEGVLYVGTMRPGKVYAVVDEDGNGRADAVHTIASDLFQPNGVAFRAGSLYVAEINRVLRYDQIDQRLESPPEPIVVLDDLPSDRHHGWKFIRFGPDGKLYVPVGAPCNICEPELPYASIHRMNADGSDFEPYARGIRNTVGFDWHPITRELWFTDNGRDMMGDDLPADELNRAPEAGIHFGYPYCHGATIADPEFGGRKSCDELEPPALELGAHVAAIGMRFYTGNSFPERYRDRIFIAEHGSWNRSQKSGYRVITVALDEQGRAQAPEPFVEGWLEENRDNRARPILTIRIRRPGSLNTPSNEGKTPAKPEDKNSRAPTANH